MATRSGMPARTRLRTAARRKSWRIIPGHPAPRRARAHGLRKTTIGLPSRWNTHGQLMPRSHAADEPDTTATHAATAEAEGEQLRLIDSQNLNLAVRDLGWQLNYERFRVHLTNTYHVTRAYLFLGFLPQQQRMYQALRRAGYVLIFKPVTYDQHGKPKGNVDAELVLRAMIDFPQYDQAIVVTSDGDFACLVRYLRQQRKLRAVISGNHRGCSALLKRAARGQVDTLDGLRFKLEYTK